ETGQQLAHRSCTALSSLILIDHRPSTIDHRPSTIDHRYRHDFRSAPCGAYVSICFVIFSITSSPPPPHHWPARHWKTTSPLHFGLFVVCRNAWRFSTALLR